MMHNIDKGSYLINEQLDVFSAEGWGDPLIRRGGLFMRELGERGDP